MGAYIVKNCKDCDEIDKLQGEVSKKIYELTEKLYFKIVYLSDKAVCKQTLKDLIYYKKILNKLAYNSAAFDCGVTRKEIISQIKKLLY